MVHRILRDIQRTENLVSDRDVYTGSEQPCSWVRKRKPRAHQWASDTWDIVSHAKAAELGGWDCSPSEVSLRMVALALHTGPGLRLLSISRWALAGEQRAGVARGLESALSSFVACSSIYTLKPKALPPPKVVRARACLVPA